MRSRRLFTLLGILTLFISLTIAAPISHGDSGDGNVNFTMPEKQPLQYPNLGSHLNQIVAEVESGALSVAEAAANSPIRSGGSVAVTLYLSSNVDDVVDFLTANGGDPRNVGEDYIEAYVPVTLLGRLSQQLGVIRVREIIPPEPAYGNFVSQGVQTHLSQAWNEAGYSGQGIKVGVIDLGFYGLSSAMGTELPTNIRGMCYTDIGEFSHALSDCDVVDEVPEDYPPQCIEAAQRRAPLNAVHGTAVSEAVIDIAPEVSLYVANPFSRADMQDVVQWMASEGVSVINYSASYIFDGPGDGTSPSTISPLNTVDQAVASDILWVNSAGNGADGTWFGDYSDPDGDRAIGFGGQNDEVIDFPFRECRTFSFQLRWEDDWDGANTDLNLHLYHKPSGSIVISSDAEQSGRSGDIPFERLPLIAFADSEDFGIVVFHRGGPVPDWIQLVYWGPGSIEHHTVSGSIGNPAESANPGMLAVGATHYWDPHTIANYSSQGPTPDGRVKPDIVGTACGETASYPHYLRDGQDCWFAGTSQASPHVAGLAALVRQQFPGFTPAQVAGYLKSNAEQRESPDPNNTWGHGFSVLPPPGGCDAVEIAADGSAAQGTWANDCQSEETAGRNARYYQLTLAEASDVTITLEADAPEPVLHLRQGADATSGDYIGFNEGESEYSYRRAVIEQSLGAGTYTIEARTYSQGYEGPFTLTVSVASGFTPGPHGCDIAIITPDGSPVSGTWSDDCQSEVTAGRNARYYQFTLTEAAEVTITLEADAAEPVLHLREGASNTGTEIAIHEGFAPDYRRAEMLQSLEPGTYNVEARTYSQGYEGPFTLTVSVAGGGTPGPGGCDIATITPDGSAVKGTWANQCPSEITAGRNARYYSFTLDDDAGVIITLGSDAGDAEPVLHLREGESKTGTELYVNEGLGPDYTRAQIAEANLAAGTYTIEAKTYSAGYQGLFTLTVHVMTGGTGGPPRPGVCVISDLPTDGSEVKGTWGGNCESETREGRYARYYQFTLDALADVSVVLESGDAETVLYLREGAGVTSGDYIAFNEGDPPNYHRTVIEQNLDAGSYTIEATTYAAGETGAFTLTVSKLRDNHPPHRFTGNAFIDGQKAPQGTLIEAVSSGRIVAASIVETLSANVNYVLDVPRPPESLELRFRVGGHPAAETAIWRRGSRNFHFDLNASTSVGPSGVPVATALAPLGDNLLWAAQYDNATGDVSVYDPSGTFSASELPPDGTYSGPIGDLTHMVDGGIYWIKVAQAQRTTLGGRLVDLYAGLNLIVFEE